MYTSFLVFTFVFGVGDNEEQQGDGFLAKTVWCGLGTNLVALVLLVHPLRFLGLYVLQLDNPWVCFLSSWPLFALCHHFVLWYCADKVYPSFSGIP